LELLIVIIVFKTNELASFEERVFY